MLPAGGFRGRVRYYSSQAHRSLSTRLGRKESRGLKGTVSSVVSAY